MNNLIRTKPRPHETISIAGRTKWRLDALCVAGRRSRTATIEVLMDFYFKHNKSVGDWVAERMNDPHPVQLKSHKNPAAPVEDAAERKDLTP